jgi:hypothetical protein
LVFEKEVGGGGPAQGGRRREGKDLTVIIISWRRRRSIVSTPGRRGIIAAVMRIGGRIIAPLRRGVIPLGRTGDIA